MVLTNFPYDPLLDLAPWVGQRQCTYRFDLINGTSGENKGEITPIRGASLSHDTGRVIKRQLTLGLGVRDTALVDPVQDRVLVAMVFPNGQEYPLGRYMFTDESDQIFTSGELSNVVLNDEMYLVDQAITQGFDGSTTSLSSTNPAATSPAASPAGFAITSIIIALFNDLPVRIKNEPSPFTSTQSWGIGTKRGSIIEDLALTGDYFSPWFGNDTYLHFIRAFNPATQIPDLDWDSGNQVMRASILRSSNILNAPNRFVVISNAPSSKKEPTFAVANIPANAPHSFEKRGFIIADVRDISAVSTAQCAAIAANLAERQMIFETTTITTAPDPRHDSYNVIRWQGSNWLELSWTMTLTEGAPMSHTLRRSYR
jgi:hypothetical protein